MDILTMLFLLFVACLLWAGAEFLKMRSEVRYLRAYIADLETAHNAPQPVPARPSASLEPIALPNAGMALKNPPASLDMTLDLIRLKGDPFAFPVGWYTANGQVDLATAQFIGDVNHILVTGQTNAGKDNLANNILLTLARTHSPTQLQVAFVDGKMGLDYKGWRDKQHTWLFAPKPEDLADAMKRLTAERNRRYDILDRANVSKWDNYRGGDLPLLVVLVSELYLLEGAVGSKNLNTWLTAELSSARAAGIRYIILTQSSSNFDQAWRNQINLNIAGFLTSDTQVKPCCNISSNEIAALGAVPPNKMTAKDRGVFVAIQDNEAINIRTSLISDAHRDYCLTYLPNKPKTPSKSQPSSVSNNQPISDPILADLLSLDTTDLGDYVLEDLPDETEAVERSIGLANGQKEHFVEQSTTRRTNEFSPSQGNASAFYVELPLADEIVPFAEQRRIIEAAQTVKTKRQLSLKLYNTDGGAKSTWVRLVCDALGLLQGGAAVGK